MTTSSTPVRLDTSVVGGRSSVEETLAVGQHFTPAVTADFLCEQVRASISKPLGPVRVADPAAGEGALLRPLALQSHNTCIGIERDEPVASRGTDVGVKVGDGLFDDRLALGSFDVVVANPPFGRASNLLEEHQWDQLVAGDAYSIWGHLDGTSPQRLASRPVEHLFIERCLQVVAIGGVVALILPDGLFANQRTQESRNWILQKADPLMVVALPGATFRRPGLHAMAHLLLLRRRAPTAKPAGSCLMVNRVQERRGRLPALMERLTQDLRRVRDGQQLSSVCQVDVEHLDSQRWDAGFGHGRHRRRQWSRGVRDVPLGDFVEHLTYGPIVTGSRCAHLAGGILSIRQGDFTETGLQLHQAMRVEADGDHAPARSRVQARDLLMPRSGAGALGKNRLAVYLGEERANIGCFVDLIRLREINPFYVWLFLRSAPGWEQIKAAFNGVGTPNINFTEIRSLRIPLLAQEQQLNIEHSYLRDVLHLHQAAMDVRQSAQAQSAFANLVCTLETQMRDASSS